MLFFPSFFTVVNSCNADSHSIFYLVCFRDDHGFTPFLWACREGQATIFDMLLARGARINATNDGGDNGLHLAASKGHKDIVLKVQAKCLGRSYIIFTFVYWQFN